MLIVTGMHRSGTSCTAGLLTLCGYRLGTSHDVHNTPNQYNEKGYFENKYVYELNNSILASAGGTSGRPPAAGAIETKGKAFASEIKAFAGTFNGTIIKDPRLCLTISLWEEYCRGIEGIVFCLRDPLSVAQSLHQRENLPIEYGLQLWYTYNSRFFEKAGSLPITLIDYDHLKEDFDFEFGHLLRSVRIDIDLPEARERIKGFFDPNLDHSQDASDRRHGLPEPVQALYRDIKAKTFRAAANRQERVVSFAKQATL